MMYDAETAKELCSRSHTFKIISAEYRTNIRRNSHQILIKLSIISECPSIIKSMFDQDGQERLTFLDTSPDLHKIKQLAKATDTYDKLPTSINAESLTVWTRCLVGKEVLGKIEAIGTTLYQGSLFFIQIAEFTHV